MPNYTKKIKELNKDLNAVESLIIKIEDGTYKLKPKIDPKAKPQVKSAMFAPQKPLVYTELFQARDAKFDPQLAHNQVKLSITRFLGNLEKDQTLEQLKKLKQILKDQLLAAKLLRRLEDVSPQKIEKILSDSAMLNLLALHIDDRQVLKELEKINWLDDSDAKLRNEYYDNIRCRLLYHFKLLNEKNLKKLSKRPELQLGNANTADNLKVKLDLVLAQHAKEYSDFFVANEKLLIDPLMKAEAALLALKPEIEELIAKNRKLLAHTNKSFTNFFDIAAKQFLEEFMNSCAPTKIDYYKNEINSLFNLLKILGEVETKYTAHKQESGKPVSANKAKILALIPAELNALLQKKVPLETFHVSLLTLLKTMLPLVPKNLFESLGRSNVLKGLLTESVTALTIERRDYLNQLREFVSPPKANPIVLSF